MEPHTIQIPPSALQAFIATSL